MKIKTPSSRRAFLLQAFFFKFMCQPLTTLTSNETFNLDISTIGRSLGREVLKTCNKPTLTIEQQHMQTVLRLSVQAGIWL